MRQTEIALERLGSAGIGAEIRIVKTSGDMFLDRPLHMVSGRGVFVREIDDQMLEGSIDLAVHSMKDLPSKRPPQLCIAAVMERDSPYDILVTQDGSSLDELAKNATVGTSSMRRASQLRRARDDLEIKSLRGNLQTRLSKLKRGDYDAIILAKAGLERMGYDIKHSILDPEIFVPSANQGTIVVVALRGTGAEAAAKKVDHEPSRIETMAERIILEEVGGGCVVPMAVHAHKDGNEIRLLAEVLSLDGKRYVRVDEWILLEGYMEQAHELGRRLVGLGGKALVEEAVSSFGLR